MNIPAAFKQEINQNQSHARRRTAKMELLIIGLAGVTGFVASARFDLFERFVSWSQAHDKWQADELATLMIILALGACIFAWRRLNELSTEVSRRRGVEESLRRSEASFKQIVEDAGDLIYKNNDHGLFTFCNPTTSRVLKYSEGEMLGKHYLDVIKSDCRSEVDAFYRQQMLKGIRETYKEITVIAKDGEELLLGLKVQLLTEAGRIVGFQTVARDITERRRGEEELRKMQEYQNLFRLANDSILVLDAEDGTVLDATEKACETYGIALEEFIGRNLGDLANDPVAAKNWLKKMSTEEKLEPCETVHLHADGTPITFLVSASLVEYRSHKAILSINRDITEQKRAAAEQSRLQSERDQLLEQLQLQMEFMPIAFTVMDENLRTTYWNPAAERIFGFTKEEVVGKSGHLLIVPKEAQAFVEGIFDQIASGEAMSSVGDNITKDGRLINCDWHAAPLKRADGTFVGIMAMAQDITERKQAEATKAKLEAQLRQSQKMEAIGTLAGGIAHDFNNMLAAIIGYCELALMDLEEDDVAAIRVTKVLKAGHRAKELVRQILTFSRREEHERKQLKLQPIIDEALTLLRASLPSSIEIRQDIDAAASSILGDSTQIHQVLMNLCTNAWHAMDEQGGVLEVRLSTVQVDVDFASAHPGLEQGPHVQLVIADTGKGMDGAMVERIFEPFFTTKPPGSGTGLGLAVVHGIIKQFGGVISVYSEVGKGTTFNIYLPTHDRDATPAPAIGLVPRGNGEHILFVDDEKQLASLGKSMLERLGYRVTTQTSSVEALKTFSSQPLDFDLVITDQTMPHLSGAEFAKVLLEIRPQLPVILATGYSTAINQEKAQAIGIREFLLKPNTAQSLGEAIHRALKAPEKINR
jgi:PAS domain S-box-containing protein